MQEVSTTSGKSRQAQKKAEKKPTWSAAKTKGARQPLRTGSKRRRRLQKRDAVIAVAVAGICIALFAFISIAFGVKAGLPAAGVTVPEAAQPAAADDNTDTAPAATEDDPPAVQIPAAPKQIAPEQKPEKSP